MTFYFSRAKTMIILLYVLQNNAQLKSIIYIINSTYSVNISEEVLQ